MHDEAEDKPFSERVELVRKGLSTGAGPQTPQTVWETPLCPSEEPPNPPPGRALRPLALLEDTLARARYVERMRILHTMLRVGDLDKSLDFYTRVLGMQLLRRKDYPDGRFTLAFVGFGPEDTHPALELTHNWDTSKYELGNAYGHVALGVTDIHGTCDAIRKAGGKVVREPGPMKHGTTVIAFVEDPDGYRVELIQQGS